MPARRDVEQHVKVSQGTGREAAWMERTAGALAAVGPPELWELWSASRWTYEETNLPFCVLSGERTHDLALEGWAGAG